MRKLNTSDLMTVVAIFGKVGTQLKTEEGMTNAQVGIQFLATAAQYAEEDLTKLLASVSEMEVEEFKNMPIDYPIEVIEHLAENEDLQTFFTRVKGLTEKVFKK
jgi:hypothetical protein